ncbi:hypothetical protein EA473_12360 [Natrarchaeobius chitinivorans]|uniref:Uncharacterized protein n=1 Tax=Natrarchaeobius chitinivorans TaxID=1679083 RepID=A0A3N6PBY6_NATCH|nr:hypothetical protein EA473_12360 [Natrarchaeobius chitinivorans]
MHRTHDPLASRWAAIRDRSLETDRQYRTVPIHFGPSTARVTRRAIGSTTPSRSRLGPTQGDCWSHRPPICDRILPIHDTGYANPYHTAVRQYQRRTGSNEANSTTISRLGVQYIRRLPQSTCPRYLEGAFLERGSHVSMV